MKKYKEVILQDGVTLYFDDNNCCEKIKIEKDIDTLILSGPDSAKEWSYDFNLSRIKEEYSFLYRKRDEFPCLLNT